MMIDKLRKRLKRESASIKVQQPKTLTSVIMIAIEIVGTILLLYAATHWLK
jgi:hypothetical protein